MSDTRLREERNARAILEVRQAMQARDIARANSLAERALEDGVEDAFLYNVRALWLHQAGEQREALRAYHHARELAPNEPMILNGISGVLSAMGHHRQALEMLQASYELAPNLATTNYMLGWTHEALSEYTRARGAYERALQLQPNHVEALAGLATTQVRLRDFDSAIASAQKALSLNPGQFTATTALAMADLALGRAAESEKRLRGALAQSPTGPARAIMLGVLGDALDAQNRPHEAFEAYTSENATLSSLQPARPESDVSASILGLATALESCTWSPQMPGRKSANDTTHVFLVGFPRSGTTLMEQVLAAHPTVETLEEVDLLDSASQTYLGATLDALLAASEEDLDAIRTAYWQGVKDNGLAVAGKVFIDKLPFNTTRLPLIARLFPDARVIFAVRDPRDVVFSCFRRHFHIRSVTREFLTLESAARLYDATMRVGRWSRTHLPLAFHELRYEKLVSDFDEEAGKVCRFLDIEWNDRMRDFANIAERRELVSLSASQVRRGLNTESVGTWRRYADELAPVMPALKPWIESLGYPAS
jgi:tetratricopeptide (TPR) repeat protein